MTVRNQTLEELRTWLRACHRKQWVQSGPYACHTPSGVLKVGSLWPSAFFQKTFWKRLHRGWIYQNNVRTHSEYSRRSDRSENSLKRTNSVVETVNRAKIASTYSVDYSSSNCWWNRTAHVQRNPRCTTRRHTIHPPQYSTVGPTTASKNIKKYTKDLART